MISLTLIAFCLIIGSVFSLRPFPIASTSKYHHRSISRSASCRMSVIDVIDHSPAILNIYNTVNGAINSVGSNPAISSPSILLSDEVGYSNLSLYFTLGLYLLSLPGLFSLVSRSVKVTPVIKTYEIPGPANPTARPLRQTAAEIMAYFKALNYEADISQEVITFRGVMGKSKSQAAFLTFCTFVALGSAGLVGSILFPDVGSYSYLVMLLSPYAGIYYWNNAQRVDEVQVKMETADDEQTTAIVTRGGKEDLERFSTTLKLPEQGKVYVKGLFDGGNVDTALVEKVTSLSAELQAKDRETTQDDSDSKKKQDQPI